MKPTRQLALDSIDDRSWLGGSRVCTLSDEAVGFYGRALQHCYVASLLLANGKQPIKHVKKAVGLMGKAWGK